MARVSLVFSLIIMAVCTVAQAQDRQFTVTFGQSSGTYVPVQAPYEGPAPSGAVSVMDTASNETVPAMVHDGALHFVAKSPDSESTRTYKLQTTGEKREPVVQVTKRGDEDVLDVRINDELFTSFHYSAKNKKPFLWPLNVKDDVGVTRDWPMGEKAASTDHPHQKSAWTAYGNLNGVDFWTEGGNAGYQTVDNVEYGSGDAFGWIKADMTLQDKDRNPIISEHREYRFYAAPEGARLFDLATTFEADHGAVKWGDTKEGGLMSVRMADALLERGGTGKVTTSEGAVGAGSAWGKPAAWCDYSGTLDGAGAVGVTIMDHPENLRHPTSWHVRDYGLMGANSFGYNDFTRGEKRGDWELADGAKQTFRYRVYVHSGDVESANVAEVWNAYSKPPKAE